MASAPKGITLLGTLAMLAACANSEAVDRATDRGADRASDLSARARAVADGSQGDTPNIEHPAIGSRNSLVDAVYLGPKTAIQTSAGSPSDILPDRLKGEFSMRSDAGPLPVLEAAAHVGEVLNHTRVDVTPDCVDYASTNKRFADLSDVRPMSAPTLMESFAAAYGCYVKWTGAEYRVSRREFRIYELNVLPGNHKYTTSLSGNQPTTQGSGSSASTSATGPGSIDYNDVDIGDFWANAKGVLGDLAGPDGKVSLDATSGTVSVEAIPTRQEAVSSWVSLINRRRTKGISIEVQLVSVQKLLSDQNSLAVNWNGTAGSGNSFTIGTPTSPVTLQQTTGLGSLTANVIPGAKGALGGLAGTSVTAQALSTKGNTQTIYDASAFTLSDNRVFFQAGQQTTYLASVGIPVTTVAGQTTQANTNTLTPGVVNSGLALALFPRLQRDGQLLMRISLTSTALNGITTASSGGQSIQTPQLATKSLPEQEFPLRSGDTIAVTGLTTKDIQNTLSGSGWWWNWFPNGGAVGDSSSNDQLVLLVTARVSGTGVQAADRREAGPMPVDQSRSQNVDQPRSPTESVGQSRQIGVDQSRSQIADQPPT